MRAIKDHGGLTIVQSAESAESPRMPEAAIRTGAIDYKLDLAAIADKLIELSQNE
jgi:chemotaxis response regulator CheB